MDGASVFSHRRKAKHRPMEFEHRMKGFSKAVGYLLRPKVPQGGLMVQKLLQHLTGKEDVPRGTELPLSLGP